MKTNSTNSSSSTVYKRLQPSWKKEPTYEDLNKDRSEAESTHSAFITRLEEYRETRLGGEKVVTRKNRSSVRPLVVRKQNEWKYPSLEEPFLSAEDMYNIRPRTAEDQSAAQQNEILINYYWATKVNKVSLVGTAVRRLVDEGTVIIKTGWYSKTKDYIVKVKQPLFGTPEESYNIIKTLVSSGKITLEQGQALIETGEQMPIRFEEVEQTDTMLIENYPTYEVCDNENIIVDPTCRGDLNKAQFVIHEYESDYNTLKEQEYDPKTDSGLYKNLSEIDFDTDNKDIENSTNSEAKARSSNFTFSDKARKKVKVSEYWGYLDIEGKGQTTAIVCAWIGEVMVRMEKNPFAHGKIPFSSTTYMPRAQEFHGEPDAALLKENQESIGKMTRAYHDITTTKAVGQKLVRGDLFQTPSEWDLFNSGNDARTTPGVDPRSSIHQMSVESIDPAVFQVIQMQTQDAEELTGKSDTKSGGGYGANSVASMKNSLTATSKREMSILRRMNTELFQHMGRLTVMNMQAYVGEEEVVRITDNEFVTIRREELQGEFDLIIDISTPEADAEKAQQLTMLLQTNNANMDPALSGILLGKIMRLWKMPADAKRVEDFKPEPNPQQEALVKLQMENAQLENDMLKANMAKIAKGMEESDSKIQERESRAIENKIDQYMKAARAEELKARAGKLEAETDVLDQKFLSMQDGTDTKERIDDLMYREESKLEGIRIKALTGLENSLDENPIFEE